MVMDEGSRDRAARPLRLLLAATPVEGHTNPLLAIVRMARARGHEVLFATVDHLAPTVEAAGARRIPMAPGADNDLRRLEQVFPERASLPPGPAQFRFDMEHLFIDPMPAQAETLRDAIARHAPDVIIVDSAFLGVIPLLLDRLGKRPPIVACGITILTLERPDGATFGLGLPPTDDEAERVRYRDMAAEIDAGLATPIRAHLDSKLAAAGLPGLPFPFFPSLVLLPDAYLQPTARSFEYGFDLPANLHFVGPLPPPPRDHARPDWWDELDGPRRVVLVTQGTVANSDFSELIEPAIAALADRDDLLVVVTTGNRPVTDVRGPLPANVRIETFLDFHALLPRVDVLVTNGGYGTVCLALQAGIPIVAVGRTEDKAEVGARVAWTGVGIELPTQKPTASELRDAIGRASDEQHFRDCARTLAHDLAAIDTEETIFSLLHELAGR